MIFFGLFHATWMTFHRFYDFQVDARPSASPFTIITTLTRTYTGRSRPIFNALTLFHHWHIFLNAFHVFLIFDCPYEWVHGLLFILPVLSLVSITIYGCRAQGINLAANCSVPTATRCPSRHSV